MAEWLTVQRMKAVGEKAAGLYRLDCSYIVCNREDVEKKGLEHLISHKYEASENQVVLKFGSGMGTEGRTIKQARYNLVKLLSDTFEEMFGVRLWIEKDLNDTLV